MAHSKNPSGDFTLPDTSITLNRMGYGAMQLAGRGYRVRCALEAVAASLQATPMQVALSWLLHRSPNVLLIPGTSSVEHIRENLKAATLELAPEAMSDLDGIDRGAEQGM